MWLDSWVLASCKLKPPGVGLGPGPLDYHTTVSLAVGEALQDWQSGRRYEVAGSSRVEVRGGASFGVLVSCDACVAADCESKGAAVERGGGRGGVLGLSIRCRSCRCADMLVSRYPNC